MEWNDSIENPDAEEKRLKELIEQNPKDAQAHYELGEVYEYVHDFTKAIEFCEKAIVLNPRNETYCAFLVFLYGTRAHDDKKLLEAAANLAELEPDESDYLIERAIDSLDGVDSQIAHEYVTELEEQGRYKVARSLELWIWNR